MVQTLFWNLQVTDWLVTWRPHCSSSANAPSEAARLRRALRHKPTKSTPLPPRLRSEGRGWSQGTQGIQPNLFILQTGTRDPQRLIWLAKGWLMHAWHTPPLPNLIPTANTGNRSLHFPPSSAARAKMCLTQCSCNPSSNWSELRCEMEDVLQLWPCRWPWNNLCSTCSSGNMTQKRVTSLPVKLVHCYSQAWGEQT